MSTGWDDDDDLLAPRQSSPYTSVPSSSSYASNISHSPQQQPPQQAAVLTGLLAAAALSARSQHQAYQHHNSKRSNASSSSVQYSSSPPREQSPPNDAEDGAQPDIDPSTNQLNVAMSAMMHRPGGMAKLKILRRAKDELPATMRNDNGSSSGAPNASSSPSLESEEQLVERREKEYEVSRAAISHIIKDGGQRNAKQLPISLSPTPPSPTDDATANVVASADALAAAQLHHSKRADKHNELQKKHKGGNGAPTRGGVQHGKNHKIIESLTRGENNTGRNLPRAEVDDPDFNRRPRVQPSQPKQQKHQQQQQRQPQQQQQQHQSPPPQQLQQQHPPPSNFSVLTPHQHESSFTPYNPVPLRMGVPLSVVGPGSNGKQFAAGPSGDMIGFRRDRPKGKQAQQQAQLQQEQKLAREATKNSILSASAPEFNPNAKPFRPSAPSFKPTTATVTSTPVLMQPPQPFQSHDNYYVAMQQQQQQSHQVQQQMIRQQIQQLQSQLDWTNDPRMSYGYQQRPAHQLTSQPLIVPPPPIQPKLAHQQQNQQQSIKPEQLQDQSTFPSLNGNGSTTVAPQQPAGQWKKS